MQPGGRRDEPERKTGQTRHHRGGERCDEKNRELKDREIGNGAVRHAIHCARPPQTEASSAWMATPI